jgi:predicted ATPase
MLQSLYRLPITLLKVWLAEGLGTLGRSDEGVALIDETIRSVQTTLELTFMPELLRVKGGFFLSRPYFDSKAAEACFAQSLELSRQQGARAWELRTAIDLARLWADRGKPEDGRKLLEPILEQFTEGRDTADLQTAECWLAESARVNKGGVSPPRR